MQIRTYGRRVPLARGWPGPASLRATRVRGCVSLELRGAADLHTGDDSRNDAPEMIDADVCLTSFSQLTNRKCFTCSACSCGQKQVVTKTWQENCKQTGTYQHRDATVRVSYSAVVNL
eukprot:s5759_g3.t1